MVTVIALLAKGLIDKMMERETSSDENTGTARKADGDVMAEASRAVERMRADVSKSAPEGSCLYDVDTDVKNLLTVVKIQVS